MQRRSSKTHRGGNAPSQRQLRAGELVRRALADVVARGTIRDPELADRSFTITEVRMSPDLRHATCFVAPLGHGDSAALAEALGRVRAWLRGQLSKDVAFKFMPDLSFEPDTSFDNAEAIDRLLHKPEVARDLSQDDDADDDRPDSGGED